MIDMAVMRAACTAVWPADSPALAACRKALGQVWALRMVCLVRSAWSARGRSRGKTLHHAPGGVCIEDKSLVIPYFLTFHCSMQRSAPYLIKPSGVLLPLLYHAAHMASTLACGHRLRPMSGLLALGI